MEVKGGHAKPYPRFTSTGRVRHVGLTRDPQELQETLPGPLTSNDSDPLMLLGSFPPDLSMISEIEEHLASRI